VDCKIIISYRRHYMWTVIYIAANQAHAEMLKNLLVSEGILANIRPVGVVSMLGDGLYEILVLESEAEEANAILCQHAVR
jgi:hypothetical protein